MPAGDGNDPRDRDLPDGLPRDESRDSAQYCGLLPGYDAARVARGEGPRARLKAGLAESSRTHHRHDEDIVLPSRRTGLLVDHEFPFCWGYQTVAGAPVCFNQSFGPLGHDVVVHLRCDLRRGSVPR